MELIIPEGYDPKLTLRETHQAIKYIRDTFQDEFAKKMNLYRVSAPLFLEKSTGLNDDLNGVERKVSFDTKVSPGVELDVVQSLAKWKRMALGRCGFQPGEGLYTNMNAIRRDEEPDNIHAIYVDQWDWEKVITKEERTEEMLKKTVVKIFRVIKHLSNLIWYKYPEAAYKLPDQIYFIDSEELRQKYPGMTSKERENAYCKEKGAIFVMRIGDKLGDGRPHDGRAPDYDDWQLNGDILFWFEPLQMALEISSMGIRVSEESLHEQLVKANALEREQLPYHRSVLEKKLPYSIGGGIGQSRLCMLLLGRVHVGEVLSTYWPKEMVEKCEAHGIHLL